MPQNLRFLRQAVSACLLCLSFSGAALSQSADPTYWQDIRPVFRKHCTVCHSAKNVKELDVSGGLALDSFDAVKRGAKTPVFEPGQAGARLGVGLLATAAKEKGMPARAPALGQEK